MVVQLSYAPSGYNKPQVAASHDSGVIEENAWTMTKSPEHVTYLTDIASQLSDFTDDPVEQSKTNKPIRSENGHDLDHDGILGANEVATSSSTHLENSETIEGLEAKGFQYEFSSSNFTTKVFNCCT